jgi:hypothetical protein
MEAMNEADAAWDDLADRREEELLTGHIEALPLDVVIARLEARFPGETHRCVTAEGQPPCSPTR